MRKITLLAASVAALALMGVGCSDDDDPFGPTGRAYEVTIENLTGSQPFSPGILVTHSSGATVWRAGVAASEGLRMIAENGDPATAAGTLPGAPGVSHVVTVDMPVHRQGGPGPDSAVYEIDADEGADLLSLAVMLICTNDGFTGLDSMALPTGFDPVSFIATAWDAGTEANEETAATVVDACQAIGPVTGTGDGANDRTPTSEAVMQHGGIMGGADLDPAAHGWQDPVARITVRRIL